MSAAQEVFVSELNRLALKEFTPPTQVRIFDTTLRDGEQTPNVALSTLDKLRIARALDELGVDAIEAGFPINSPGEREAVKRIAQEGLKAEIVGLARANKNDIDACLDCDLKSVHVFLATSDIHLTHKLKLTREQVVEKAIWAIGYAKSHGVTVEWSCEDATRTDVDFLKRMHIIVQEGKVDRINVPDTVGCMTPQAMSYLIRELRTVTKVPLSVHCHNDFGLAVANTLAGIIAGAQQAHVTINGLGERAGNAALEEVALSLLAFYGVRTNVNTRKFAHTSKLVSKLTGVVVQPNKAIVGDNAFAHESGIHVHGILSNGSTYEPLTPELVGKERSLVVGKHTGAHSVEYKLKEYGFELKSEQIQDLTTRVKHLAESGKKIDDAELIALAYDAEGRDPKTEQPIKLEEFTVFTGLNFTPTATVSLLVDGERRRHSESGVGPIDAAIKAIRHAVSEKIVLREFKLDAITGGSDALCEVQVKLGDTDEAKLLSLGKAVGSDIVTTSVDATVEALNRLYRRRVVQQRRANGGGP